MLTVALTRFAWLVFAWILVQHGRELGSPPKLAQVLSGVLVILMLLVLVGAL